MSKVTSKMYQKCDLCYEEWEIKREMPTVVLPGEFVSCDGYRSPCTCKASICESCMKRLHEIIKKELKVEEIDYGGVVFGWKQ